MCRWYYFITFDEGFSHEDDYDDCLMCRHLRWNIISTFISMLMLMVKRHFSHVQRWLFSLYELIIFHYFSLSLFSSAKYDEDEMMINIDDMPTFSDDYFHYFLRPRRWCRNIKIFSRLLSMSLIDEIRGDFDYFLARLFRWFSMMWDFLFFSRFFLADFADFRWCRFRIYAMRFAAIFSRHFRQLIDWLLADDYVDCIDYRSPDYFFWCVKMAEMPADADTPNIDDDDGRRRWWWWHFFRCWCSAIKMMWPASRRYYRPADDDDMMIIFDDITCHFDTPTLIITW